MKILYIILITIFSLSIILYLIFFQLIPYIRNKKVNKIIEDDSQKNDIDMRVDIGAVYKKSININVPLIFNRTYNIVATFANSDGKVILNSKDTQGKLLLNIIVTDDKNNVIATSNFNNNIWKIENLATKNSIGTIILTPDQDLINSTELNLGIETIKATINNPVQYTKDYIRISGNYSRFFSFNDLVERVN